MARRRLATWGRRGRTRRQHHRRADDVGRQVTGGGCRFRRGERRGRNRRSHRQRRRRNWRSCRHRRCRRQRRRWHWWRWYWWCGQHRWIHGQRRRWHRWSCLRRRFREQRRRRHWWRGQQRWRCRRKRDRADPRGLGLPHRWPRSPSGNCGITRARALDWGRRATTPTKFSCTLRPKQSNSRAVEVAS